MVDQSNIYGGYLKASRYAGIKDTDLTKALKPYGIGLGFLRKRERSDADLRKLALRAVTKKYRKAKHKPKAITPGSLIHTDPRTPTR